MIDDVGGVFVTSVDVYFQTKSDTVPVQCQIRTMNTGYPTTTILPFGQVTVQPNDVSISDDASVEALSLHFHLLYFCNKISNIVLSFLQILRTITSGYLTWEM